MQLVQELHMQISAQTAHDVTALQRVLAHMHGPVVVGSNAWCGIIKSEHEWIKTLDQESLDVLGYVADDEDLGFVGNLQAEYKFLFGE
jgi:hypothetical protein